ncbi:hypothetical protein HFO27_37520 [Rhizobium leguminosarum]|uniref:hypothetical protein n=1 Tax=Rhizobium leguminosarum TaxID=384 RepID=UPI001C9209FC|nr:hypothetical protein [Rhizobium leguminosarum]MBY3180072.1 hypothetical protein [Rhizobium leguminosarum]
MVADRRADSGRNGSALDHRMGTLLGQGGAGPPAYRPEQRSFGMGAQSARLEIVLERVMAGHLDDFAAIHQAPPNPFARCLSALEPDQTELRSEQQLDFLLWG